MDVFRVFDALNDIRNRAAAVDGRAPHRQARAGHDLLHDQPAAHGRRPSSRWPEQLMDLGCDSICIKDMAALLKPQPAYDIVHGDQGRRAARTSRVHVHVHATTGVTLVSLMKAIEAGADVVDTAISSMSLGPGHNPTESLVEMLEGTGYDDQGGHGAPSGSQAITSTGSVRGTRNSSSNITGVETEIFDSQIPGGMISNMESQLKQQGAGDRVEGSAARKCRRCAADAGLSAARHPVEPDRRHAGRLQRADGTLQGADRRIRRPHARLLRRSRSADAIRPSSSGWKHAKKRRSRPACRSAEARVGASCAPAALAPGL